MFNNKVVKKQIYHYLNWWLLQNAREEISWLLKKNTDEKKIFTIVYYCSWLDVIWYCIKLLNVYDFHKFTKFTLKEWHLVQFNQCLCSFLCVLNSNEMRLILMTPDGPISSGLLCCYLKMNSQFNNVEFKNSK